MTLTDSSVSERNPQARPRIPASVTVFRSGPPLPPWSPDTGSLDFATLRTLFRTHRITPQDLIPLLLHRIRAANLPNVFITLLHESEIRARLHNAEQLARTKGLHHLPLYGIPFTVKDNIDVAGLPTTAACKPFTYTPTVSAAVVQKLEAAGAILLGKTNLDQFATGLTGLLSDFGPTRNPFNPAFISGGSSSGAALSVAAGFASFAVATDTAGSGRVPAAFNNLVGLKPTRGAVSTAGLLPACRSLDCISFLANNVDDAAELLTLTRGFDSADPFSRREANDLDLSLLKLPISNFRFGVPRRDQLDFFNDPAAEALYDRTIERLKSVGGTPIEIDASPFLDAGKLLYEGPWIAERLASISDFHAAHPEAIHPVTRALLSRASDHSALSAYQSLHRLQELKREAETQWALMDLLLLPTTGSILALAEAAADPAATSARLGLYTNFVNLLDLTAIALPAGFRPDGLPLGFSLIAPAFSEPNLVAIAQRLHPHQYGGLLGATTQPPKVPSQDDDFYPTTESAASQRTSICVVGAYLSGQPFNNQLTELDGQLVRRCKTAPKYRLYLLPNSTPARPGLVRAEAPENGVALDAEVWSLPNASFSTFVSRIPAPLCLGTITLDNGEEVKGFLCEPHALTHSTDISQYGGWLNYLRKNG